MGRAEVLAAMEDAAHEEEERLLGDAHVEAERLINAARDDVAAMRERHRRRAADAAALQRARLRAAIALERARQLAQVRDELVDRAFEAARAALEDVRTGDGYAGALRMLVDEALDHFPPEQPLAVTCDPRDVAAISDMVRAANRTVTVEGALDCRGGLVVADAAGRVIVDNTLERRIERAHEVLWSAVAAAQADCLDRAASAQRVPALS